MGNYNFFDQVAEKTKWRIGLQIYDGDITYTVEDIQSINSRNLMNDPRYTTNVVYQYQGNNIILPKDVPISKAYNIIMTKHKHGGYQKSEPIKRTTKKTGHKISVDGKPPKVSKHKSTDDTPSLSVGPIKQ